MYSHEMSAFKDVERLPYSTDNATRLSPDFRAAKLKDQCISSGKKSYDKDEKDKKQRYKTWKPFVVETVQARPFLWRQTVPRFADLLHQFPPVFTPHFYEGCPILTAYSRVILRSMPVCYISGTENFQNGSDALSEYESTHFQGKELKEPSSSRGML